MYFWNYGMQETWLDKYLKSPVSEHPSTVNMLKTPKHFWYLHESSSNIFTVILVDVWLESLSLINIWNLRTVW